MNCACTNLTVSDIMKATDTPFTLMVKLISQGWQYDEALLIFTWKAFCEPHADC